MFHSLRLGVFKDLSTQFSISRDLFKEFLKDYFKTCSNHDPLSFLHKKKYKFLERSDANILNCQNKFHTPNSSLKTMAMSCYLKCFVYSNKLILKWDLKHVEHET